MRDTLRIGLLSEDPRGLSPFGPLDRESLSVVAAVHDALVHIDAEGNVCPALAVAWRRVSALEYELDLRAGVRFHDGERFDADAVVRSFEAHVASTASPTVAGVLSTIRSIRRISAYSVRVETHAPDARLVRRLGLLYIVPPGQLVARGPDSFAAHPVGTGAYRFVRHVAGQEVVLARNPDHWAQTATVDRIELPIGERARWVDALAAGDLDVAFDLDAAECARAQRLRGARGLSRAASTAPWFVLSKHGALADLRVRRALNHAVDRRRLVDLVELGLGAPQHGLLSSCARGDGGDDPYPYDPARARRLLAEAGYERGLTLHGVVDARCAIVFAAVQTFLRRVGVELTGEPAQEHSRAGSEHAARDFALVRSENPLFDDLSPAPQFLRSEGRGAGWDDAAASLDMRGEEAGTDEEAQRRLEGRVREEAMLLFTVEQHTHAAFREGVNVALSRTGHVGSEAFWTLRDTRQRELGSGARRVGQSPGPSEDPLLARCAAVTRAVVEVLDAEDAALAPATLPAPAPTTTEARQAQLDRPRREWDRATVNILRFRDVFATFVRDFDRALDRGARGGAKDPEAIRTTLHTAKGILSQFGVAELVERIHAVEDLESIDAEALRMLRAALRAIILAQRTTLGIDLAHAEARYTITESTLRDLEQRSARAVDFHSLRAVVQTGLMAMRDKSACELVGPLEDLAMELAARKGKRLRLFVEGGDVAIPTRFVGVLGNLVHLVRNAIVHGLEAPADRGDKDPVGTVLVSFGRSASGIRIAVSDDGRGIDADGLAAAALRMGLASAEGLARMRDEDKVQLLFRLGVSTAQTVTEAAGRGVGAAALREAVEAAGGHIEVQNHPGAGATFTIDLPLAERVATASGRASASGGTASASGRTAIVSGGTAIAPRRLGSVRPTRTSSLPPERAN